MYRTPALTKDNHNSGPSFWTKLKCKLFGHGSTNITCFHNDTVQCVDCGLEHTPSSDLIELNPAVYLMAMMHSREQKGIKQPRCSSPCCPKNVGF